MGLNKPQAFRGIVLPQAVRHMLPAYFSNLISLLKGTAIVGYIAITDLTKVGDIIRSNTYEAVVPLMTVALIYLALAGLILLGMNLIQRRLTGGNRPKRIRQRVVGKNREKLEDPQSRRGGEKA